MNRLIIQRVGVFVAVIGVAAAAGVYVLRTRPQEAGIHAEHAAYYCPMHPRYTSDRPGDCPICGMRLVKKDAVTSQAPAASKDICYLHQCPRAHDGKPCPMTVVAKPGEKVICPICGAHVAEAATPPQEKKILYWTDPMIPGYKSDKPGKSPMGMDLVPVYEEAMPTSGVSAVEGYTPILLSPQKQQLIGMKTAQAARQALTKTIRASGRIAYDPDLYQAEQEYLQALKASAQAKASATGGIAAQAAQLVEASRTKLRIMGLSQPAIEEMAAWQQPDQSLLLTEHTGKAWVYASVYEQELPLIALGQSIRVEAAAAPGTSFQGAVRSIDPVLDPATRTARIRAVLEDPQGLLRPEMYVTAVISIPLDDALAVPAEAVFHTGTRDIVFVAKGQGVFEPREVTVGQAVNEWTQILSGLQAGDSVVVNGNFLIDSESRLKAALSGMSAPSAGSGHGEHQHGQ